MKTTLFATAAIVALGLAACGEEPAAPADPAAAADPEIAALMKARHDNYEDLGKNFKVLLDNSKLDAPDMAAVSAAAAKVQEYAGLMPTWFPAGTGPESGIETEAKANIWTDRATFDAAITRLQGEAAKLVAATDAAAFKGQFGATGLACKNCHDTFREEKDN